MDIFSMSVTYLQSVENIKRKLLEELISQSMYYQPLKNNVSASNFFMHIFNMSITYLQSVEKIQWKL